MDPPEREFDELERKLDSINDEYDELCSAILSVQTQIKHPPPTRITRETKEKDADGSESASSPNTKVKVNSALKPEKLTEHFTPREFTEF